MARFAWAILGFTARILGRAIPGLDGRHRVMRCAIPEAPGTVPAGNARAGQTGPSVRPCARRIRPVLVEAVAEGLRAPGLLAKLDALEARRATLSAEAAVTPPTAPGSPICRAPSHPGKRPRPWRQRGADRQGDRPSSRRRRWVTRHRTGRGSLRHAQRRRCRLGQGAARHLRAPRVHQSGKGQGQGRAEPFLAFCRNPQNLPCCTAIRALILRPPPTALSPPGCNRGFA